MSETDEAAGKRYEYLKIGIVAFLFLAAVLLLARTIHLNNELEDLRSRLSGVSSHLDSLKMEFLRPAPDSQTSQFLSYHDIRTLKTRGLSDPVNTLKSDLMQQTELIPHEGVLGGSMQFYKEYIYVLSSRWVMAYFDDGHIAGYMLLEYEVSPGGDIRWQVIDSYLG